MQQEPFLSSDSDPDRPNGEFLPEVLDRTVIAVPLLRELRADARAREADPSRTPRLFSVILDLNTDYHGQEQARDKVRRLVQQALQGRAIQQPQGINEDKSELSDEYMFAVLEGPVLQEMVRLDNEGQPDVTPEVRGAVTGHRAIHSVWPDFAVKPLLTKSVITVKADAARVAFSAVGDGVVWAVLDSGVDAQHPHFQMHRNLELAGPLERAHRDFTGSPGGALQDPFGHGTHVAGIIAGEMVAQADAPITAYSRHRDEQGNTTDVKLSLERISGVAPRARLVSMKVLDDNGLGDASSLIVALEHVQRLNKYGRNLRIHGVNMSVGYGYEPEWFACGQSPVCVEVNRLVRSGVVVVIAAGNTGYGWLQAAFKPEPVAGGMSLSINDPGNAELGITVGSTHRESPHLYGVSYFSSKGPTGDGRPKPDLIAPGEKIISCAAGARLARVNAQSGQAVYVEDSGTSMAAPHVSGAVAAFLSIRNEFIGRPETVKDIFLSTATDLKRDPNFQGRGLVDLIRAIQSV
jgi:serine protease AprX